MGRVFPIFQKGGSFIETILCIGKLLSGAFNIVKCKEDIDRLRCALDWIEGRGRKNTCERRTALALELHNLPTMHSIAVKVLHSPAFDILSCRNTMDAGDILRPQLHSLPRMNHHRILRAIHGDMTIPHRNINNGVDTKTNTPLMNTDITKWRRHNDRTKSAGNKTLHPELTMIKENRRDSTGLWPIEDIPKEELRFWSKTKDAIIVKNNRRLSIARTNMHRVIQNEF